MTVQPATISKHQDAVAPLLDFGIEKSAALLSPRFFAKLDSRNWFGFDAKHIRHLDEDLRRVASGEIDFLSVSMPPRHMKSTMCSVYFPVWFMGQNPDKSVMLISFGADVATRFGRMCRDLMEEWGQELFGVRLRQDSRSAKTWQVQGHRGELHTAGVNGPLTGRGADLFIIDDPVKDDKEALSPTQRENAKQWWESTAKTRLEAGGRLIVIGTRWHEDDLIGYLIRTWKAKNKKVVSYPAIATSDEDPIGREKGAALWPEKYPLDELERRRTSPSEEERGLGPFFFEAMYQQNPVPQEGGLFKRDWFRHYQSDAEKLCFGHQKDCLVEKEKCFRIFSVDLAVSTEEQADFFCLGDWMVSPDKNMFLDNVVHARIEGPDQATLIEKMYHESRPQLVFVESNAYQLSLVQTLRRKGLRVKGVRADRDKVARAHGAATQFSIGKVHFRGDAPWLGELQTELLTFPSAKHDDYVDMVTLAINEASHISVPAVY